METAIVVVTPEAAAAVDGIRRVHTQAGREGAPAHVTLLVPFVASEELTPAEIGKAADVISRFAPFEFALAELRSFEGAPGILYLAPDPAEPFVRMTEALTAAFPEHPPYGGRHAEIVPHLTVAQADGERLRAFAREITPRLPLTARVTEAWILQRDDRGRWQPREPLPLGGARPDQAGFDG